MQCPRCESKAVYRLPRHAARRKSAVLRLAFNPFQCGDCGARFWRIKGNLLTIVLLIAAIFAVVVVVAMTINTSPPAEEQFKFSSE
jgi:hypothetical protein